MKFSIHDAQLLQDEHNVGMEYAALPHDELLLRMGAQLGAIEAATDYAPRYTGIVVVEIVSCEKHPDADSLQVCLVDDGGVTANVARNEAGLVQVVCGAPNARAGIRAVWLPPGATVPSTYDEKEPFVLGAKKLRGVMSNGMLGSPKELGLSDNHDGILEVPVDMYATAQAGVSIAEVFGLNDFVVDCENKMFTHRPDCFGTLGIAREVAGIFGQKFTSPLWYLETPATYVATEEGAPDSVVGIENTVPHKVPRFMAQALLGIDPTATSAIPLQAALQRSGIRPINLVVDVTNYYMQLTAQPTHAFDYDKLRLEAGIKENDTSTHLKLAPRMARADETLVLLGGKTIHLSEEDIIITANDIPVALAGVMGGAATEVDETTTNIVIECATFDMFTIRKTSMRHGLFTDAVTRFSKGQSPLQNDRVLAQIVKVICDATGGTSQKAQDSGCSLMQPDVAVSIDFINTRLGTSLEGTVCKDLLESVEFQCQLQGDLLHITIPFWRMDIAIPEDIVEEIARLYGLSHIPVVLPSRTTKPSAPNKSREYKQRLRTMLSARGAHEVLTYSFVHGSMLKKIGLDADEWAYHIRNAISPDLQYYRPSLLPSLLAKVHQNIKASAGSDQNMFALYEFGKAHIKGLVNDDDQLPQEMRRLSFVLVSDDKSARNFKEASAYYHVKRYIDDITDGSCRYTALSDFSQPDSVIFYPGRSAEVSLPGIGKIGVVGEFSDAVCAAFKLPRYSAGFELDSDGLQNGMAKKSYQPLSNYPSSQQDITFEVTTNVTWSELNDCIKAELHVIAASEGLVYTIEPVGLHVPHEASTLRSTFRINVAHYQRTLRTEEVSSILTRIATLVGTKFNATRI